MSIGGSILYALLLLVFIIGLANIHLIWTGLGLKAFFEWLGNRKTNKSGG